ncbi:tripartite tricarboxylate transporter substrate-binding protein [Oceanobacillus sp. FSL K6-2867]|uniref:tripartite tricarboxylate transporter substrate binding protein n=1 Tax=Oceanobacillus sp. FSL K6-2867 TaxID=2954748 RepID=UPI0030D8A102
MKKFISFFLISSLVLFLAACGNSDSKAGSSADQETGSSFPEDQIEVVVPFAAGGASDLVSRTIATEMEKELGVPVVITNKTGGSGATGLLSVKDANPDGYTIGYVPVELAMLESLGLAEISPEDYAALGQLMTIPAGIIVSGDAPYNSVEEFVEHAKENPGEIKIGNSGTGSIWHIAAAAFAGEADIEIGHVPYDGAAPAVTALMGGHIDAVTVSPSEAISGIESGDLKVLAVMSEERDVNAPDSPTLQELGYDINLGGWGGFVAPKEIPEDVLEALKAAFETAYNSDAFQKLLEDRGMNPDYKPGDEFQEFAKDQYDFYSELIPTIEFE